MASGCCKLHTGNLRESAKTAEHAGAEHSDLHMGKSLLRVCGPPATFLSVAPHCEVSNCRNLITWVHSSVVRAADCRSAGPWFKSGCALGLLRFRPWHLAAASCTQGICAKVLKMPSTPGQSTAFSTCASLCFESVGRPPPVFSWCHTASSLVAHSASLGYIAQWSERLTADQQVPGSNPGVPSDCGALARGIWVLQAAHRDL